MSFKKKIEKLENFDSSSILNKSQCDCGCKKCKTEKQLLREKLLELCNILELRITRQSLNGSLNNSFSSVMQTSSKETASKGCSCKKGCSNRCGCVKKGFSCGKLCKCDKSCKNQVENKVGDSDSDSGSENLITEPLSFITKREIKITNHSDNNSQDKENDAFQDENFDPMKPRHQLARSPLPVKNHLSVNDNYMPNDPEPRSPFLLSVSNVDISLANASIKSMANDLPEELQKPIIDYEKYKAELKNCPKCSRTFRPERLEKHQAVCKKK